MTTSSSTEPGLGENWSSFGAIVVVSLLGPTLVLLLSIAPVFIGELASAYLDFSLCWYLGSCAPGAGEAWSDWLIGEFPLLYVVWVALGTGFACVVTLEVAFRIFRRAAPLAVLGWHAALILVLAFSLPIDLLRSLISVGWAGTGLVSAHYFLSYTALPLYRPPKAAAESARESCPLFSDPVDSAAFPSGLSLGQRLSLGLFALHGAAMLGVACYAFVENRAQLFVTGAACGFYMGLLLFHRLLSATGAETLTMDGGGLTYRGERLSWGEIGRVWRGPKGCNHVVMIETPAAAAKRLLQATNWINRLFALCEVGYRSADMVAHAVTIDTRFHLGEAAELVRMIEARRPPGSQWTPAVEGGPETVYPAPALIGPKPNREGG